MIDFEKISRQTKEQPWLKYIWSKRGNRSYPPGAVLCDRTTGFGNPFVVGKHGDHDQCCDKFDTWIDTGQNFRNESATEEKRQWILNNVKSLKGKDLLCWCKPKRCHTETLARKANQE